MAYLSSSGSGSQGLSWFSGSSRCQMGLYSFESLSGAGGAVLRWPFHIDGRFVMTVGRTSPQDYLSVLTTW